MRKALIVCKWLALLPVHLVVVGGAWLLAPIAVRWFSTDDKLHLRSPFRWMETIDNDMGGDSYWKAEHLAGSDALNESARIGWAKRNGGNAVNYGPLGVPVDPAWLHRYRSPINGQISGGPLWWSDDAFCLRWMRPIGGRIMELSLGWALLGPKAGRAKYWLSGRFERQGKS
jgi:hypothetical protein